MATAAGEALKHFIFVVPEVATAEEEKTDTESLQDVPVVPTTKVPGQGPGWVGLWGAGGMEKGHCGRAVKMCQVCILAGTPSVCPEETALLET